MCLIIFTRGMLYQGNKKNMVKNKSWQILSIKDTCQRKISTGKMAPHMLSAPYFKELRGTPRNACKRFLQNNVALLNNKGISNVFSLKVCFLMVKIIELDEIADESPGTHLANRTKMTAQTSILQQSITKQATRRCRLVFIPGL